MITTTPRRLSVSDKVLYGDRMLAALAALVEVCPHDMPHPGSGACMKCDALKEAGRLLRDLSREGEGQ